MDLARLNLSYTVIVATCDGVTGRKDIHEGQLVQPGQTMVDIVDNGDLWVIANYRETQLPNIKEGAEVTFTADAVPGITYKGVVESISDATGAAFLLDTAGQCHRKLCQSGAASPRPHPSARQ